MELDVGGPMKLNSVLAAIGIAAPLLAACSSDQVASFKSSLQQIADRANGQQVADAGAPGQQGPGINDTPLHNIFADKPYDTQKPFAGQYPRVALTVLSGPADHGALWQRSESRGYWMLKAKIWTSPSHSQDVGPFSVQIQRDAPKTDLPTRNVTGWLTFTPTAFALGEGSTGNRRTEGPNPPDHAIPTDPAHARYFDAANGSFIHGSNDALMFVVVLNSMDFDSTVLPDRRVWIVKFVPASGP